MNEQRKLGGSESGCDGRDAMCSRRVIRKSDADAAVELRMYVVRNGSVQYTFGYVRMCSTIQFMAAPD